MGEPTIKTGIDESKIKDKGQQIADLLRPNTFGLYNGNPKTLSEWVIYIIAWPIFMPLTWCMEMLRWLMVATRFTIWHILGMIGLKNVQPLINDICNELGPNNPLYPLFDMLRNPDSEFGAAIIDQAIGGGIAMGINRILDPLMRPVGFAMEENLMNQELPENVYVSGVRKGVIDWGNFIQGMRRYGYNEPMARKMFNSLKLAPGVMETLDMLNRGIISDARANELLLLNDFTADINAELKQLRWYVPTAQDVVQFAVREVYDAATVQEFGHDQEFPNDALKDAQAAGLNADKFRLYWYSHWRYPSPEQIYTMLHRGVVDTSVVNRYLKMQDYSPYWRDKMRAISFRPYTRVDVRRMYKTGVIDEGGVLKTYKDLGYDAEHAQKLTEYTIISQTAVDKALTLPTILTGYKDRLIDRNTAIGLIQALGYSAYDTELQLALADFQKMSTIVSLVEKLAKEEYTNGIRSLTDCMGLLREYGVTEERIEILTELWPLETKHTVKNLTESDLRKSYSLGLISGDDFRNGLATMGYTDYAMDLIITLENMRLEPTRIGGIPPGLTTTGVVKMFTKAELKAMLIGAIIDPDEWAYQMSLLGYSEEQIYYYAQLYLTQMESAS